MRNWFGDHWPDIFTSTICQYLLLNFNGLQLCTHTQCDHRPRRKTLEIQLFFLALCIHFKVLNLTEGFLNYCSSHNSEIVESSRGPATHSQWFLFVDVFDFSSRARGLGERKKKDEKFLKICDQFTLHTHLIIRSLFSNHHHNTTTATAASTPNASKSVNTHTHTADPVCKKKTGPRLLKRASNALARKHIFIVYTYNYKHIIYFQTSCQKKETGVVVALSTPKSEDLHLVPNYLALPFFLNIFDVRTREEKKKQTFFCLPFFFLPAAEAKKPNPSGHSGLRGEKKKSPPCPFTQTNQATHTHTHTHTELSCSLHHCTIAPFSLPQRRV